MNQMSLMGGFLLLLSLLPIAYSAVHDGLAQDTDDIGHDNAPTAVQQNWMNDHFDAFLAQCDEIKTSIRKPAQCSFGNYIDREGMNLRNQVVTMVNQGLDDGLLESSQVKDLIKTFMWQHWGDSRLDIEQISSNMALLFYHLTKDSLTIFWTRPEPDALHVRFVYEDYEDSWTFPYNN
uniref:Uncharacterized protein n=1 Tax=Spongospora subterranea TaxID=70186 RepID=A0A0H5QX85_9EUKA|eukprot:CRZ06337.1 hypothetical protein [Spongospora subterranea]